MKKISLELKWALILGIVHLFFILIDRLFGIYEFESISKIVFSGIPFTISSIYSFTFALFNIKSRRLLSEMTYKDGFKSGTIITLLFLLLLPIIHSLAYLANPNYFSDAIQYAIINNKLTLEQAQFQYSFTFYLITNIITSTFSGLLMSSLIPLIVNKLKLKAEQA